MSLQLPQPWSGMFKVVNKDAASSGVHCCQSGLLWMPGDELAVGGGLELRTVNALEPRKQRWDG
jgi:hypothetical protein